MYHRAIPQESRAAERAVDQPDEGRWSDFGGAISGEHGIGLAKTPFLRLQHSPAAIRAMRAVKRALDPRGILNPGKMFEVFRVWESPSASRCGCHGTTRDFPFSVCPRKRRPLQLVGLMYLKALKLHGFKSFADPTTLHFEPGVTAVVGPNGCGKSNIADSIRWVLGEQSAKALRGGKMQDVIFEGADTRRAAQMCEVSLLLTDCEKQLGSEFHEIEITRRVHRDGQGEYLFNGQACRLKDIHKLFMDTGVGRTSYSIMAQGQIDQVLSSKPEERRAVFEEAAGITKYKSQRREAMGKLALTDQNLARVADVVGEVARQIGSLKRQAAKAMRYKRLGPPPAAPQPGLERPAARQAGRGARPRSN